MLPLRPLSITDLRELGHDDASIRTLRRRGELVPIVRGLDVPRSLLQDPPHQLRAIGRRHPDAVLSGAAAARVRRLDVPARWPDEISVGRSLPRPRARPGLIVSRRRLDMDEVVVHDGLRVTTTGRTVADLMCDRPGAGSLWVACQALARGLHPADVDLAVGRRGVRAARQLLDLADPRVESALEAAALLVLADHGVPPPVLQHRVDGLPFRLDFAWPRVRVGLEADGAGWHGLPDSLVRDRVRQNALAAEGWTLLRTSWWQLHHDATGLVGPLRRLVG